MKKIIIEKCMSSIKNTGNYSDEKLAEIKYGLEGIYLTISKLIVVITLSFLLNITKEVLIFLLIYNFIRMASFGLHATKSWICLLSSTIIFIGLPFICKAIELSIYTKLIIGIVLILLIFKNSPADTYKRPIINPIRRKTYKLLSTLIAIVYVLISIIIKDNFLANSFLMVLVVQSFMISPTVYKIFNLPYNNYKNYLVETTV